MEKIKNLLKARERQLLKIKSEKEKALENAPEGMLRVCCHGNQTKYFLRDDPKDFSGRYIPERDRYIAQELAQKDYDRKVLTAIEKELKAMERYHSFCPEICAEKVYERLHKARRKLIEPILIPEDQYIHEWETAEYQKKSFYEDIPEFYTMKGERVRSKSEVLIADLLNKEGIPYRYECPLYLKGLGNIYPDFTVLNVMERKEIYWEHLGMMDEPAYFENAVKRISGYEQNGIFLGERLILTYETRKIPINQKLIRIKIEKYLK